MVAAQSVRDDELAEYYAHAGGLALGGRFIDAVAAALDFVTAQPLAGAPRDFLNPRLHGLRSWPVPDFEDVRLYYLEPVKA